MFCAAEKRNTLIWTQSTNFNDQALFRFSFSSKYLEIVQQLTDVSAGVRSTNDAATIASRDGVPIDEYQV